MSISNKVKWKFASDQTNSNNSNNSKFYIDNDNEQIDCENKINKKTILILTFSSKKEQREKQSNR